jgi:hypothetical protein
MRRFFTFSGVIAWLSGGAFAEEPKPDTPGANALASGMVATYRDEVRSVSEAVLLPELGLAAEESPHPAIQSAFTARFEGFLMIAQAGTYQFDTKGTLTLNGETVAGARELEAGNHPITLTYRREPGPVRFGVSWQSEHFVKEPLPPSVLAHPPIKPRPENAEGPHPAPSHRIRTTLAAMKCASCHDTGFLATMHHKFAPDSLLTLMRHANTPKWYGALTGPVIEENEALRQLADDLGKLPNGDRVRGETATDTTQGQRMSGTRQGLACIACHDIKHHRTEAESKGPNLSLMSERVTYDWFVRWMENPQRHKPGVPMPAFFAGQPPEERKKNIDALWDYLAKGRKMELPEELHVDPHQFVLKPATRPIHTRTYIVLPDGRELLRAICVGLPNGVSYCFDAATCQLAYVWTGGFLDMAPHWQNQSGMPTPPIGETFHLPASGDGLRIDAQVPVFRGYEIVDGIPRFEFDAGETRMTLLVNAPATDQVTLTYSVVSHQKRRVTFTNSSALDATSTLGTWTDQRLTIELNGNTEFTITLQKK